MFLLLFFHCLLSFPVNKDVYESNLVRLLITVSYRNIGEQDVLVAPAIILFEEQLLPLPAPPIPAPMHTLT